MPYEKNTKVLFDLVLCVYVYLCITCLINVKVIQRKRRARKICVHDVAVITVLAHDCFEPESRSLFAMSAASKLSILLDISSTGQC